MPNVRFDHPKNIVLFSDGTGNSASKAFKTNVWRTYQALDLDAPSHGDCRQVAHYRDGVGTETFKPFALLGSVFGFGVMRDVRALYTFLCRTYREGDRIYAFGFSRGAFTIRLLVGLVGKCGLVQAQDENGLFHAVNVAFGAYRRDFLIRASGPRWMIYDHVLPPPFYDAAGDIDLRLGREPLRPTVAFLGLWDTVDAYGMPIEEIKQGIDEWIWPMSLADRSLPKIVEQACHALSLDDERPTFRPVLWDEKLVDDKKRLEQVWFAGVHANVGGGYPIDDLSYVPLVWMLERAKRAGLRFFKREVDYFSCMRNVHGTAYDSRAGVAGYYRYGPRSVQKLCDDDKAGVHIALPIVHATVAERIAARIVNYAPRSLPLAVALPDPDTGRPVQQNKTYLDLAWDTVLWRRITYFLTLALTFFLVLAPFFFPGSDTERVRQSDVIATYQADSSWDVLPDSVVGFASRVADVLPKWAAPWLEAFEHHPIVGGLLLGLLAWLFFAQSATLQRDIGDRSEWAWAQLKGNGAAPIFTPQWSDRFIHEQRVSSGWNAFGKWYDQKAVPFVVGVLLLALLVVAGIAVLYVLIVKLRTAWLEIAGLGALAATWVAFVRNIRFRNMLEATLKAAPGKPYKLPERSPFGGANSIRAFKAKAADIRLPDGSTLLESYIGPVLLPNDLYFAAAFGLFIALADQWLVAVTPSMEVLAYCAWFGLIYAATDMAEDIVLAKALDPAAPAWMAHVAPWLTRAKMLFIALSVAGLVGFGAMMVASRFFKPATPSRFG